VLSIMGASFSAMWDAVGEEGMMPFVVSAVPAAAPGVRRGGCWVLCGVLFRVRKQGGIHGCLSIRKA
jgi:hypothetical protein